MKKIGELMKEIGFNPDASDAVKEAFIKYLVKQSAGDYEKPTRVKYVLPTQLTFSFDNEPVVTKKKTAV